MRSYENNHIYVRIYIYIYICVCVCMYVCMYKCMCVYNIIVLSKYTIAIAN